MVRTLKIRQGEAFFYLLLSHKNWKENKSYIING